MPAKTQRTPTTTQTAAVIVQSVVCPCPNLSSYRSDAKHKQTGTNRQRKTKQGIFLYFTTTFRAKHNLPPSLLLFHVFFSPFCNLCHIITSLLIRQIGDQMIVQPVIIMSIDNRKSLFKIRIPYKRTPHISRPRIITSYYAQSTTMRVANLCELIHQHAQIGCTQFYIVTWIIQITHFGNLIHSINITIGITSS